MRDKPAFIDSNVAIYAYSEDDIEKRDKARLAITNNYCFVSTQTLNEFCNVCIRKLRLPVSVVLRNINDILEKCEYMLVDVQTIKSALQLQGRYGYSYFDSLMIASALECECECLFSEDLQDGQVIAGLTIENIFRDIL